jgi:hypothetical protein
MAAIVLLVFVPLHADPPPPSYPPDLDLSASVWEILNGGATLHNDAAGSLYFDFPVEPDTSCKASGNCGRVNYLFTTHTPRAISGILTVTLRVDTTGTPSFEHTSTDPLCTSPASVRAMIWSKNNSLHDGYRWWSNPIGYVLGAGTVTWHIPIDPAWWSGVDGKFANYNNSYLQQFNRALDDVSSLAVTFGGGCAFGHGVFVVGGTARFTIENYEVQPTPSCPSVTPCNGSSCLPGAEIGDTNTDLYQCLDGSNVLQQCTFPQSFHVVSKACYKAPCCTATPFPCLCPIGACPSGGYLECR